MFKLFVFSCLLALLLGATASQAAPKKMIRDLKKRDWIHFGTSTYETKYLPPRLPRGKPEGTIVRWFFAEIHRNLPGKAESITLYQLNSLPKPITTGLRSQARARLEIADRAIVSDDAQLLLSTLKPHSWIRWYYFDVLPSIPFIHDYLESEYIRNYLNPELFELMKNSYPHPENVTQEMRQAILEVLNQCPDKKHFSDDEALDIIIDFVWPCINGFHIGAMWSTAKLFCQCQSRSELISLLEVTSERFKPRPICSAFSKYDYAQKLLNESNGYVRKTSKAKIP
jgi:hypothetical protein